MDIVNIDYGMIILKIFLYMIKEKMELQKHLEIVNMKIKKLMLVFMSLNK